MKLTETDVNRFLNLVRAVGEKTDCWVWIGATLPNGYGNFSLRRPGVKKKTYLAHRISWAIFHNNREVIAGDNAEMVIRHKCHNKSCVNPLHLSWGTGAENNIDTVLSGRGNRKLGSDCNWSKLTEADVRYIRTRPMSQTALAQQFSVDPSTISQIISRKRWAHVS